MEQTKSEWGLSAEGVGREETEDAEEEAGTQRAGEKGIRSAVVQLQMINRRRA